MKKRLLFLLGIVFAGFVFKALVDGSTEVGGAGPAGLGLDVSGMLGAAGSMARTAVLWAVVIPAAAYLVYLAFMKVAPAQMRQDHAERTSKRMRKWALTGAAVLVVVAYALHYVPILARQAAAWASERAEGTGTALGTALRAVGDHWAPIVWGLVFAGALGAGYWWSTKSDSKLEQMARFGLVGIPAGLISLALSRAGVIGS